MEIGVVSKILGTVLPLVKDPIKDKILRKAEVIKYLQTLGIDILKPDFESIYVHALLKYGIEFPDKLHLIKFFELKETKKYIKEHLYQKESDLENTFDTLLHTGQGESFLLLKSNDIQTEDLHTEYKILKNYIDEYTIKSSLPIQNKQTELLEMILDKLQSLQPNLVTEAYTNTSYTTGNNNTTIQASENSNISVTYNITNEIEKTIPKIVYSKPENFYLARKLQKKQAVKKDINYSFVEEIIHSPVAPVEPDEFTFEEIVKKYSKVVILGDGGMGKSNELNYWAYIWSADAAVPYYPLRLSLKNFPTNTNLANYLNENHISWQTTPNLVLLLDGLDETSTNFDAIVTLINSFAELHATIKIVVTCRTTSYHLEKNDKQELKGKLDKFTLCEFVPLDTEDMLQYCKEKGVAQPENFIKEVAQQKLKDLVTIPFYLDKLVEIFNEKDALPKKRSDLIDKIINKRLGYEKFEKLKKIEQQETILRDELKKIAFVMTSLNKFELTEDEYHKIVTNETTRKLLETVGFWKKNIAVWQFEHNIFQEFLTAKALLSYDFEKVKATVCLDFGEKPVLIYWGAALAFLAELYEEEQAYNFYKWLAKKAPRFLNNCSFDNLDENLRLALFKELFENEKVPIYSWW